jgi:hypothetical protein
VISGIVRHRLESGAFLLLHFWLRSPLFRLFLVDRTPSPVLPHPQQPNLLFVLRGHPHSFNFLRATSDGKMKITTILAFAVMGTALATKVVPRELLSLDTPVSVVHAEQARERRAVNAKNGLERDARALSPSHVVRMTNAQRMIAGLPLLPPRRRGTRTCTSDSYGI